EIVEPHAAARRPELANEANQPSKVSERGRLGDLEAKRFGREPILREPLAQRRDQVGIIERGNAEVDRAEREGAAGRGCAPAGEGPAPGWRGWARGGGCARLRGASGALPPSPSLSLSR